MVYLQIGPDWIPAGLWLDDGCKPAYRIVEDGHILHDDAGQNDWLTLYQTCIEMFGAVDTGWQILDLREAGCPLPLNLIGD